MDLSLSDADQPHHIPSGNNCCAIDESESLSTMELQTRKSSLEGCCCSEQTTGVDDAFDFDDGDGICNFLNSTSNVGAMQEDISEYSADIAYHNHEVSEYSADNGYHKHEVIVVSGSGTVDPSHDSATFTTATSTTTERNNCQRSSGATNRLSKETVSLIFDILDGQTKSIPTQCQFKIVPGVAGGHKKAPPPVEFESGIYVLLPPLPKRKGTEATKARGRRKYTGKENHSLSSVATGAGTTPQRQPQLPAHLDTLLMTIPQTRRCDWKLSGPQASQKKKHRGRKRKLKVTTPPARPPQSHDAPSVAPAAPAPKFEQRYCYPADEEMFSTIGGMVWTRYEYTTDGKRVENLEYRILQVYISGKRGINQRVSSVSATSAPTDGSPNGNQASGKQCDADKQEAKHPTSLPQATTAGLPMPVTSLSWAATRIPAVPGHLCVPNPTPPPFSHPRLMHDLDNNLGIFLHRSDSSTVGPFSGAACRRMSGMTMSMADPPFTSSLNARDFMPNAQAPFGFDIAGRYRHPSGQVVNAGCPANLAEYYTHRQQQQQHAQQLSHSRNLEAMRSMATTPVESSKLIEDHVGYPEHCGHVCAVPRASTPSSTTQASTGPSSVSSFDSPSINDELFKGKGLLGPDLDCYFRSTLGSFDCLDEDCDPTPTDGTSVGSQLDLACQMTAENLYVDDSNEDEEVDDAQFHTSAKDYAVGHIFRDERREFLLGLADMSRHIETQISEAEAKHRAHFASSLTHWSHSIRDSGRADVTPSTATESKASG